MDKTENVLKSLPQEYQEKIQFIVALRGVPLDSKWIDYDALKIACEYGERQLAKLLLDWNCRVNLSANSVVVEKTPLYYAVKHGDVEIIKILLSKQASVLASDIEGNTPLHLAFLQRQEEIVDLMLTAIEQTSTYFNAKNHHGLTHLHIACTRSNIEVISGFLKAGASIQESVSDNSTPWTNFTALHFAVKFKSLETVAFLEKISSTNDNSNCNGLTALDLANQQLDEMALIVQQLSKKKNVDPINAHKQLPHESVYENLVCMRDDPVPLENVIQNGASVLLNDAITKNCAVYRPLQFAVESNCLQNIEELLKCGVEVGHQNDQGMTPLHLAFYKRDQSKEKDAMVSVLYAAVKNPVEDNRTDENGLNYFHIAIAQNDLETVKKFLTRREPLNWSIHRNSPNFSNFTPLHFATLYRHYDMAELLIKRGACVNVNDEADHGTPLHMAIELADFCLIELFLKNGAQANVARFKTGKTVLHLLVDVHIRVRTESSTNNTSPPSFYYNIPTYFERLVGLGCEIDAKDSNGDTALHLVCSDSFWSSAHCARILLHLGADINLRNCWGSTPFTECLFGEAEEMERGHPADYIFFYEHVQKLMDLGKSVDPKNIECCEALLTRLKYEWGWANAKEFKDETLAVKIQQRLNEVEKMKDLKLTNYFSLYDFMQNDVRRAAAHARNRTLSELLGNDYLMGQLYPEFGYLIRVQYVNALNQ